MDEDDDGWRWPRWWKKSGRHLSRIKIPEGGGHIYQFPNEDGEYSYVFVPELKVWVAAIAQALSEPVVTSITLDLASVTHTKQPVPQRG